VKVERESTNHKYDADTWVQLQYHNERIYHNFEFFIKITLAIAGGLAYLSVNKITGNAELVSYVVKLGAIFELLAGLVSSTAIYFHVKSKLKRYEHPPKQIFKVMWGWLETYFVIFILVISCAIAWAAWFKIAGELCPFGRCAYGLKKIFF
jgi:hypothetical protein